MTTETSSIIAASARASAEADYSQGLPEGETRYQWWDGAADALARDLDRMPTADEDREAKEAYLARIAELEAESFDADDIAEEHLRGIEGGLRGAVADLRAGMDIDAACGLGDSWGVKRPPEQMQQIFAAVRRIVREAAAET